MSASTQKTMLTALALVLAAALQALGHDLPEQAWVAVGAIAAAAHIRRPGDVPLDDFTRRLEANDPPKG